MARTPDSRVEEGSRELTAPPWRPGATRRLQLTELRANWIVEEEPGLDESWRAGELESWRAGELD